MDFSRRHRTKVKPEEIALAESYPHELQMYSIPPMGEISLTEFEQLAVDRLKGWCKINLAQSLKCQ